MANENFFERVYAVARDIPYGKLHLMALLQKLWDRPPARMVGWAMNASHNGMMFQHIACEQKRITYRKIPF
jgi:methylated-DNA-protein-cysteine methyltransferase-like protein